MKKKSLIVYCLGFIVVCYVALSAYVIARQGIEELLVCADNGGLKIPFSKTLCRGYLFTLRGSQQDINELHQGVGTTFIVQGESPIYEREQVLKYLITKGLNVNNIDMHQLTPLHSAVIVNSPEIIETLLRNGADLNAKDKKFNLTPLDLAVKLQSENNTSNNRQAVISLLKTAK